VHPTTLCLLLLAITVTHQLPSARGAGIRGGDGGGVSEGGARTSADQPVSLSPPVGRDLAVPSSSAAAANDGPVVVPTDDDGLAYAQYGDLAAARRRPSKSRTRSPSRGKTPSPTPASLLPTVFLFDWGTTWSYLDTNTDLTLTNWRSADYTGMSSWKSGMSLLGFGFSGVVRTALQR
jgi:hypothetical protein